MRTAARLLARAARRRPPSLLAPSWAAAARPDDAAPLVEAVARALEAEGVPVATGRFGAMMDVELVNDGPVTLVIDSDDLAATRR